MNWQVFLGTLLWASSPTVTIAVTRVLRWLFISHGGEAPSSCWVHYKSCLGSSGGEAGFLCCSVRAGVWRESWGMQVVSGGLTKVSAKNGSLLPLPWGPHS